MLGKKILREQFQKSVWGWQGSTLAFGLFPISSIFIGGMPGTSVNTWNGEENKRRRSERKIQNLWLLSQNPAFAVHALCQGIISYSSAEWVKRGLGILYFIDQDFPTGPQILFEFTLACIWFCPIQIWGAGRKKKRKEADAYPSPIAIVRKPWPGRCTMWTRCLLFSHESFAVLFDWVRRFL